MVPRPTHEPRRPEPNPPAPAGRRSRPAPLGPDLADADQAGVQLRREVARRTRWRIAGAAALGVLTTVALTVLHSALRGSAPTPWVVVGLGAAVWIALWAQARRTAAGDLTGVDRLRAGTIVATAAARRVDVRDSGGAVWRWHHRPVPRPIVPGERCWIGGGGAWEEAPQMVLARPLSPGRYAVWASVARQIVRLPEPQAEHETFEPPADDEPLS